MCLLFTSFIKTKINMLKQETANCRLLQYEIWPSIGGVGEIYEFEEYRSGEWRLEKKLTWREKKIDEYRGFIVKVC